MNALVLTIFEYIDVNSISITLGILGIISGLYFYINSKKERIPKYQITGFNLISNNITSLEKIKISYDNETIDNLYLTKFSFWNSGHETIRSEDFVKANPFQIKIKDEFKIYGANIEKHNFNNEVKILVKKGKLIALKFDYLDKNEGFIINIYSSAKKTSDFSVHGNFKGSQNIKRGYVKMRSSSVVNDRFFQPIYEFLVSSKYKLLLIFGIILSIGFIFIFIPMILPFVFYDFVNDTLFNKIPKEFELEKN